MSSAYDPFEERLGWLLNEIHSLWNRAPGSSFLNNSEFSLSWSLAWNTLPLTEGLADIPDCSGGGSGLEVVHYNEWVRPFWSHVGESTARIDLKQCCTTLVMSRTMLTLRSKVRNE